MKIDKDYVGPCANHRCVAIYLKNNGPSPALYVTGGALISSDGPPTGILPRSLIRGILTRDDRATWIQLEHVTEAQKEAPNMYVRARIEYCDTWNNFHLTEYCLHRERIWPDQEFWPCDVANAITIDTPRGTCRDYSPVATRK